MTSVLRLAQNIQDRDLSKQGDVMQNTKMAKMGLSENEVPSGNLT